MRILSTIFLLISLISCIKKGDKEIQSTALQDITINLLKVSPPSAFININQSKQLKAIGGNPPYQYSISSGYGSVSEDGLYTASSTLGNNTIKITDSGGNSVYSIITVGSDLQVSPISRIIGTNKKFSFSTVGGSAPYQYTIVNGSGSIDQTSGEYTAPSVASQATIKVSDSNGSSQFATVTTVDSLTISPSTAVIEINKNFSFTTAGGLAPYTYSVYAGAGTITNTGIYSSPATISTTVIRVTDANGIFVESSISVKKGPSISSSRSEVAPLSQTQLSSTSGKAPFTFSIVSGSGTISPAGLYTAPSQASLDTIRCTDANGFYDEISLQTFNLKKVSIGDSHICLQHTGNDNSSGTAKCWGHKSLGKTGDGNSYIGDSPNEMGDNLKAINLGTVSTPIGIFSSRYRHRCVLFSNNKVKCFGYGNAGRTGNGNQSDRGDKINTMGDHLPFVELGTGVTVNSSASIDLRVSLGASSTCVMTGSSAKCFGEGNYGRLGYANNNDRCVNSSTCGNALPSLQLNPGESIKQIVNGNEQSCAIILPSNQLRCWGRGSYARLGSGNNNTISKHPKDADVVNFGTGLYATQFALGGFHGCALLNDNTVKCWGRNNTGQLGLGIGTGSIIGDNPSELGDNLQAINLGSISFPTQVYAGLYRSCAKFNNGRIKCWGHNSDGQAGIGSTDGSIGNATSEMGDNLPFIDLGPSETVSSLYLAPYSTCAITNSNKLKCFGRNNYGQLGQGDTVNRGRSSLDMGSNLLEVQLGTGKHATMIGMSENSTCALLNDNTVKCWGHDENGSLGSTNTGFGDEAAETHASINSINFGASLYAKEIYSGRYHNCAKLNDNNLKCWGNNANGRLGIGSSIHQGTSESTLGDNLPITDVGTSLSVKKYSAWDNHSCAVLSNDQVKCWGSGSNGKRGSQNTSQSGDSANEMGDNLSFIDLGPGRSALDVKTGTNFTCVLMDNSQVKCFGANNYGQLGQEDKNQRGHNFGTAPSNISAIDLGTGNTVLKITLGHIHACALLQNQKVKCWGYNGHGELGIGSTAHKGDDANEMGDNLPYVDLGTGRTVKDIQAGIYHTCALLDNNKVKCWGYGNYGQLGIGIRTNISDVPTETGDNINSVLLDENEKVLKIFAGGYSTCALFDSNKVKCWGRNTFGALGQQHHYDIGGDPLGMSEKLKESK